MHDLIQWSKGNPGALDFLMKVFVDSNTSFADAILVDRKLREYKTLRGTNIYVLYSDLCNKDMPTVMHLLANCPGHILQEACSRQDYSGRELVEKYMPEK